MFAGVPRYQGYAGSEKLTVMFFAVEKLLCALVSDPWSEVRVRRSCAGSSARRSRYHPNRSLHRPPLTRANAL